MRGFLLSSAALISFGVGSAAHAEAPADQAATWQEVVVTAERRTASVQTSSLAISVISPDEVRKAGLAQARDLTKVEPGVQIGQGGPATQIYIRGVGDFGSTPATNPAVAFNVDGVYVSRSNSIEGNFYDLERIEVLKGPQGTLYGRNATGGAINVITNKPVLGRYAAGVEAEIGDYNTRRGEGYVNVPLGDKLAVRVAAQLVGRDGYSHLGFDDDKHQSVRLSALWEPTDKIKVRLTGDHTHVGGVGPAYVVKGPIPAQLAPQISQLVAAQGFTLPTDPRMTYLEPQAQALFYAGAAVGGFCIPNGIPAASARRVGVVGPDAQGACPSGFSSVIRPGSLSEARDIDNSFNNLTLEASWDLDFATLTLVPAYRRVRTNYVTFPMLTSDEAAFGQPEKSDTYSLEARLSKETERVKWVAGAYFYREDQVTNTQPSNMILTGVADNPTGFKTFSRAVFGQASYSVTPAWRLIVGGRYTSDRRTIDGATRAFDTGILGLPFAIFGPCFLHASPCVQDHFAGETKDGRFTYKLGTEYDVAPDHMVFLTYSTGYKAGGFNQFSVFGTANQASTYRPEKLAALEAGSRNRFFDRRLQVNAEAFYWKYRDAQQGFTTENAAGSAVFGITNAGRAEMYGLDLDVAARLTAADTLKFNVEYLHSEFKSFTYTSPPLAAGASACNQTPAGPIVTIDCSGKPLMRAPKWSGSVGYAHTFDLPNGAALEASIDAQGASSRYLAVDYTDAVKAKAYLAGDAYLTYRPQGEAWSLTAYVRNFNDAKIYTGAYTAPFALPGVVAANIGAPRTYGLILSTQF